MNSCPKKIVMLKMPMIRLPIAALLLSVTFEGKYMAPNNHSGGNKYPKKYNERAGPALNTERPMTGVISSSS